MQNYNFTRKLPLPLLFAFFAILIAMSPLFAEEVSAAFVCLDTTGQPTTGFTNNCFADEGSCNPACKGLDPRYSCKQQACAAGTTPRTSGGSWFWNGLFDITVGFVLKLLNYLLYGISTVLERLVALSAFLLEMAIDVSSAPFSDISILKEGWKIVRDVMNSFFVLFLFIIAIATILQLESYAWKALLPTFIIVALLVNFSFVLSGVVIDFSNVLGRTFFDKLNSPKKLSDNIATAFDINNINNLAIASCQPNITTATTGTLGTIISYTKGWSCAGSGAVQKLFVAHAKIAETPMNDIDALTKYLFVLTLRVIMLFLMIFPLLAGAALMIMRTIALMVLIIFAPAAFTAYILPATRQYATQWWTELFSKSFFFPAYLFMLYIAVQYGIRIGNALKSTTGSNTLGGTFENLATIFNFLTMVAFMFLALSVGRKSGIVGAETVMKYADAGRKWATGYAGRISTAPVRRAAEKYTQSEFAQRRAAGALGGIIGRPLMRTMEKVAKGGGREAAIQKEVDTIKKLSPRYQGEAILRRTTTGAVRSRVVDDLGTEKLADAMHHMNRGERERLRGVAFAHQTPERRQASQRNLASAYAERELKERNEIVATNLNTPNYYTADERREVLRKADASKRASLINAMGNLPDAAGVLGGNVAAFEGEIVAALGRDVQEIDKTREEIAKLTTKLPANEFMQRFGQLANETRTKILDIIKPSEFGRILDTIGATPTPAQTAFLASVQTNPRAQQAALVARPLMHSQVGMPNPAIAIQSIPKSRIKEMPEAQLSNPAVSSHFNVDQLEGIAEAGSISGPARSAIKRQLLLIHGVGSPMGTYLNTSPAWMHL